MLVWHRSSSFLVILTLMESMQVLSMLCASSKTTMVFLGRSLDTSSAILGSMRLLSKKEKRMRQP